MSEALHRPEGTPDEPLRPIASSGSLHADRREYAFQSMLQLASELNVSLGLYETVDLLMLNLMGQFRTSRSALWLMTEGTNKAVLVRHRGLSKSSALTVGTTCADAIGRRFAARREPILAWALREHVAPAALPMLEHAGIALFAPISGGDQLLGWLALGNRIDGTPYASEDLAILEASLGIVGPSILNGRLYSRVLETNRQLQASNERLGEMDQLKSDFLSNVNHELRTPLTIMIGALDCVTDQSGDARSRDHFVSLAQQNARNLWSLVENLLTFSELSRNQAPIQIEILSIREELEGCFSRRRPGVASGLRELTASWAPDLVPAKIDRSRFHQILDELIDNAVKFTPQGSRIRLEADMHQQEDRLWVRVQVVDDGPGVPAAKLTSVFNAFEQIDGSSTRTEGGLGMGLALCRQLIERMSGQISVTSEPGRGTAFCVLFPAGDRRAIARS